MDNGIHDNNHYNLKLSHKHVRVLIHALDVYTRISIAQFERILDDININSATKEVARRLFDEAKRVIYDLPPNASMSICSPKLNEYVHIGYELEKVLQKMVAEVEDHMRWSVWRDGPLKLSTEPLPKIEICSKPEKWRLKGIHPGDVVRVKRYTKRMYKRKSYGIKWNSTGIVEEVVGDEMIVHFSDLEVSLKMYQYEVEVVDDQI